MILSGIKKWESEQKPRGFVGLTKPRGFTYYEFTVTYDKKGRRLPPRDSVGRLYSFYFIALQTTSAYVFRSNDAVVYDSDLLNVCIVRAGSFTVTVAYFIAG